MLKFEYWDLIKRKIRLDDVKDLGTPTVDLVCKAIDDGNYALAKELVIYFIPEGKGLHDLYCDWCYDIFDKVAKKYGEENLHELLRSTQSTWMMYRTWKGMQKMTPYERVCINAEVLRSHRCGPRQMGELSVIEEDDRYIIQMDPCGSGGRMRRGDAVDGTGSRLAKPYNFGVTSKAFWWSWSKAGVPYYCLHCAMCEILMVEWGGWPMHVTAYDPDPQRPCAWIFYKRPELVPEEYWTRLGFKKPSSFDVVKGAERL
jgi:hypothetical protein